MKRLSIVSLLSLFVLIFSLGCGGLSGSAAAPRMPLTTPQLVSHEGYSTVALVRYDEDHEDDKTSQIEPYCTAVWIDQTHILTAFHCVKSVQEEMQQKQDEREKNAPECNLLGALLGLCDPNAPVQHKVIWMKDLPIHFVQWREVDDVGKEPTAWHLSHVVGWDEHKDLALLEAAGHAIPPHEFAKIADKTPELGESVHICGHPKGMYWTFLEGTVAGYRGEIPHMDKKAGPFMQVQSPIFFGNSGGGAFNSYGELVGIADFLMRLPAEGFFVHVDNIRLFLQDQNFLDKPEEKKAGKVVGVAPHEDAPPPPKSDDTSSKEPVPQPEAPKVEPKHIPQPSFHLPPLPPGLNRIPQ
jgi:Trypsin-like peptidase domain